MLTTGKLASTRVNRFAEESVSGISLLTGTHSLSCHRLTLGIDVTTVIVITTRVNLSTSWHSILLVSESLEAVVTDAGLAGAVDEVTGGGRVTANSVTQARLILFACVSVSGVVLLALALIGADGVGADGVGVTQVLTAGTLIKIFTFLCFWVHTESSLADTVISCTFVTALSVTGLTVVQSQLTFINVIAGASVAGVSILACAGV